MDLPFRLLGISLARSLTHSSSPTFILPLPPRSAHQFFPEVTSGFNPGTNFPLEKIRPSLAGAGETWHARDVICFMSLSRILSRTPSDGSGGGWTGLREPTPTRAAGGQIRGGAGFATAIITPATYLIAGLFIALI